MQEEANQKTVGIVVEGGKFTGRMFLRACDKYTQHANKLKPIGISEYRVSDKLGSALMENLPSIEDIENRMKI